LQRLLETLVTHMVSVVCFFVVYVSNPFLQFFMCYNHSYCDIQCTWMANGCDIVVTSKRYWCAPLQHLLLFVSLWFHMCILSTKNVINCQYQGWLLLKIRSWELGHEYNHSVGFATYHTQYPGRNSCNILHINPLNAELNPICHLLALLGAHPILHVSRIRVKQCYMHIRRACMNTDMELGCTFVLVTVGDWRWEMQWKVVGI
jgi:hypothetical protein